MIYFVLANAVWPALFLAIRLGAWWLVVVSLIIEAWALWRFTKLSPLKAGTASLVMNAISTLVGAWILLPLLGLGLEYLANLTYNAWFSWGTFNPVTHVATWVLAFLLTAAIECVVLWLVFLMSWQRRWVLVVLIVNALTVGLAAASIFIVAPQ